MRTLCSECPQAGLTFWDGLPGAGRLEPLAGIAASNEFIWTQRLASGEAEEGLAVVRRLATEGFLSA